MSVLHCMYRTVCVRAKKVGIAGACVRVELCVSNGTFVCASDDMYFMFYVHVQTFVVQRYTLQFYVCVLWFLFWGIHIHSTTNKLTHTDRARGSHTNTLTGIIFWQLFFSFFSSLNLSAILLLLSWLFLLPLLVLAAASSSVYLNG